jgi:hypothetical protein
MIATRKSKDGPWIMTEGEKEETFTQIVGGLAFGDPAAEGDYSLHGLVVVGRDEPGRYIVLNEDMQSQGMLAEVSINAKDRFMLRDIWCQPEPVALRRQMERADGLTEYRTRGKGKSGQPMYQHDGSFWTHYRDRETKARLIPMADDFMAEMDAHIMRFTDMVARHDVLIADWCIKSKNLVRENFEQGRNHPLLKALVFATMMLVRLHEKVPRPEKSIPDSWY